MALPRSGFLRESVELLKIETNLFDLYIKGKPFHPAVEALHLHRTPENDWVCAALEIIPSLQLNLNSVKVFSPVECEMIPLGEGEIFPLFYENQIYEFVLEKKNDTELSFYHENIHLRRAVKPLGKNILSGNLNFQSEVGYTDIEIRTKNGNAIFTLCLEIFPAKIDYQRDFQMILAEVNGEIYNLAFDFLRKTYQLTGLKEARDQSLAEFFAILKVVFLKLVNAVDRIQTAPHYRLIPVHEIRRAEQVRRAGKTNIAYLRKHPECLEYDSETGSIALNGKLYRPTYLLETRRQVDYDTTENRFLRWMLLRIKKRLIDFRLLILQKDRFHDELILKQIDEMVTQLDRLLSSQFLSSVGDMRHNSLTLVLQMAPGYREVYRFYLIITKGLSIQGGLFRLSLKDLAELYEYWCFLKIHSLLKRKYELIRQDIIRVNRKGLFVSLDRSRKASVTYRNPVNGELFTLFYNALPSEDSNAPTLAQRPDTVFALKKENSNVEYKYIFDAKYRLNPAVEGSDYEKKYGAPGPEEEDINTMHRYRDAIVFENKITGEFERSMFGAYVLFPYSDEEKFREHRFYKSIKKVNIGAIPFLPNTTRIMEEFLDELILDSPEKAYERSTRPRGTQKYYEDKLQGKNVLIGALRDKAQLDLCLENRVYWMPLQHLMRNHCLLTNIEWVGLYQSRRTFGVQKSGVSWIGKVDFWRVVRRHEIKIRKPRPGTENELYVLFQIKSWFQRDKPIKPGGYGIYTYLFTSYYMLERAEEIAELKLDTEEQLKEWREKRRQGRVRVKLNDEYVDRASEVVLLDVDND